MGKADASNKPYDDKGRMDLEIYYERLEPKLTIYTEPESDTERTRNLESTVEEMKLKFDRHEIKRDEKEQKMEKRIKELEDQIKSDRV